MIKILMKNAIILSVNISSKILLAKSCVRYTYACTYLPRTEQVYCFYVLYAQIERIIEI